MIATPKQWLLCKASGNAPSGGTSGAFRAEHTGAGGAASGILRVKNENEKLKIRNYASND